MKHLLWTISFLSISCIGAVAFAQVPPGSDSSVVTLPSETAPETAPETETAPSPPHEPVSKGVGEPKATTDATAVTTTVTEQTTVVTRTVDPGFLKVTMPRLSARGPNLVALGLGLRAGLTGSSTGGFMVAAQYAWQISRAFWLDSHFATAFGGRCEVHNEPGTFTECGGLSGFGADLLVGIMMQFLNWPEWNLPMNPYIRALTGVSFIISNGPHDGAAIVVRGAGGLRYAITDEFAVGVEAGLMIGPSFRYEQGASGYGAFDFLFNVEYSF